MTAYYLPDNCPKKLRRMIEKHNGSRHKVAKELNVNVYWIQTYIKQWREPTNPETRAKMFLPKTQRAQRRPDYRQEHINWWRHLDKAQREKIIKKAYYVRTNRPRQ